MEPLQELPFGGGLRSDLQAWSSSDPLSPLFCGELAALPTVTAETTMTVAREPGSRKVAALPRPPISPGSSRLPMRPREAQATAASPSSPGRPRGADRYAGPAAATCAVPALPSVEASAPSWPLPPASRAGQGVIGKENLDAFSGQGADRETGSVHVTPRADDAARLSSPPASRALRLEPLGAQGDADSEQDTVLSEDFGSCHSAASGEAAALGPIRARMSKAPSLGSLPRSCDAEDTDVLRTACMPIMISAHDFPPLFKRTGAQGLASHYDFFERVLPDPGTERRRLLKRKAVLARLFLKSGQDVGTVLAAQDEGPVLERADRDILGATGRPLEDSAGEPSYIDKLAQDPPVSLLPSTRFQLAAAVAGRRESASEHVGLEVLRHLGLRAWTSRAPSSQGAGSSVQVVLAWLRARAER